MKNKSEMFSNITKDMLETYKSKNKDYGDSFGVSVQKYGLIAALTRMSDKFNRLENLIITRSKGEVKDESLEDTLLDLASYCIMTAIEIKKE